ncbi:MAG TPA: acyl-CoA dehydrogenase family protein [Microthrixaceae bacterium]|nr:acyl-CoA dehydrogenase family protein [Microthrixaceae bacterium]
MRFAPTEDQIDFRDAVRGLLADTCPPDAVRAAWREQVGEVPGGGDGRVRAAWDALAEMGVLGVMVPEGSGGLGLTDEDIVPLLIECGRAALPDPVSSTAYVAAGLLRENPGRSTEALLARIAEGSATVLVGFPGSPYLTAAETADVFLMCDRGEVHELTRSEVTLEPVTSIDGARALCRVEWEPSDSSVIVGGFDGSQAVTRAFDRAALGAAAQLVGLGERMLDMTVGYAAERKQFGVAIGTFQAVKHHLADAASAVAFAQPLVLRAAYSLAQGDPDAPVHVSMAKARASAAALVVAEAALQCHGAIGYTVEYDLHLFMKRAWALASRYGDADFHRDRVRAVLLG